MKRMLLLSAVIAVMLFGLSASAVPGAGSSEKEVVSLRHESMKHFTTGDGHMKAVSYTSPVHFKNEKDEWEDIDTTLYDSRASSQSRHFQRFFDNLQSLGNAGLMQDAKVRINGQGKFKIHPYDFDALAPANSFCVLTDQGGQTAICLNPDEFVSFWCDAVISGYKRDIKSFAFKAGTDLQVQETVTSRGVKEDIILSGAQGPDHVDYHIVAGGLIPRTRGREIVFTNSQGQDVLIMPAPFMEDANGEQSHEVDYTIQPEGEGRYRLHISWSTMWLKDSKRAFPVVVDPTVVVASNNTGGADTWISKEIFFANTPQGSSDEICVSYYWNGEVTRRRGLTKFDFSSIPINSFVVSSQLSLYANFTTISPDDWENNLAIYQMLTNWTESATWNHANHNSSVPWKNGAFSDADYRVPNMGFDYASRSTPGWVSVPLNVTYVRDWISNPAINYGMFLWQPIVDEPVPATVRKEYCSKEGKPSLAPRQEIVYDLVPMIQNARVEDDPTDAMKKIVKLNVGFPYSTNPFGWPASGVSCSVTVSGLSSGQSVPQATVTSTNEISIPLDWVFLLPNRTETISIAVTPYADGVQAGAPTTCTLQFSTNLQFEHSVPNPTHDSVGINFGVNSSCTAIVAYRKKGETTFTNESSSPVTPDSLTTPVIITLTGLEPYQEYEYGIYFRWGTSGSFECKSAMYPGDGCYSFCTQKHPSLPYINVQTANTDDSITVTWQTDIPVGGILEVSETADFASSTPIPEFEGSTRTTTHSVTAGGLSPGTAYYLRIGSPQAVNTYSVRGNAPVYTVPEKAVLYSPTKETGIAGDVSGGYRSQLVISKAAAQWIQIDRYLRQGTAPNYEYVLEKSSGRLDTSSLGTGPAFTLPDETIVPTYKYDEPADWVHAPHSTYRYDITSGNLNPVVDTVTSTWADIPVNNNNPQFDPATANPALVNGKPHSNTSALSIYASDPDSDTLDVTYYYSTDRSVFSALNGGDISALPDNREYWWKATVTDGFGGSAESPVFSFWLDRTSPTLSRDNTSTTYAPQQVVSITAADSGGSGLKAISYGWNGGSMQEAGLPPVTLTAPNQGKNTLVVEVKDNAGNVAQGGPWYYYVDALAPVITSQALGLPEGTTGYTSETTVSVTWDVTSESGVAEVQYRFTSDGAGSAFSPVEFTRVDRHFSARFAGIFLPGKVYTLEIKALSKAGLWSNPVVVGQFTYDPTPPQVVAALTLQGGREAYGRYHISDISQLGVSVSFADPESGFTVQYGYHPENSNTLWYPTLAALKTANPAPGVPFSVIVKAVNQAQLACEPESMPIKVDSTAPSLEVSGLGDSIYAGDPIRFTVKATDSESGIQSIRYCLGTTPGGNDVSLLMAGAVNGWLNAPTDDGWQEICLEVQTTAGQTYYLIVKTDNNAGMTATYQSNGISALPVPADKPVVEDDGLFTSDKTQLHARVRIVTGKTITGFAVQVNSASGSYYPDWQAIASTQSTLELLLTNMNLVHGTLYKIDVKAYFSDGTESPIGSSNGITIDTTPPEGSILVAPYATPNRVTVKISGKDDESGARCSLAVGTTPGATDCSNGWVRADGTCGTGTSITSLIPGLSLDHKHTYYVSLKVENGAGGVTMLEGAPVIVDGTRPEPFLVFDTGEYTRSSPLRVQWPSAKTDPESGISGYWVALTTGSQLTGSEEWNFVGSDVREALLAQPLVSGTRYYVAVKAVNGAGEESIPCWSDGIVYDPDAPNMLLVDDRGEFTSQQTRLTVTLNAADPVSGISRFDVAIAEDPGSTFSFGGSVLPIDPLLEPLSLQNGQVYHVSAQAFDGAGNESLLGVSDGIMAVTEAPDLAAVKTASRFITCGSPMTIWWDPAESVAPVTYKYAIVPPQVEPLASDWTSVEYSCQATFTPTGYSQGQVLRIHVLATDCVGQTDTAYTDVTVDLTGPNILSASPSTRFLSYSTVVTVSATDDLSQVTEYAHAVGTVPGGSDVTGGWVSGPAAFSMTGLSIEDGRTYYISVMVRNGAGVWSSIRKLDGVVADLTPPALSSVQAPAHIHSTTTIENIRWEGSDLQSGIAAYRWEVKDEATGTVMGSSLPISSSQASETFTISGLSLVEGRTYRVGITVQNGAGDWSGFMDSNSIAVDMTVQGTLTEDKDWWGTVRIAGDVVVPANTTLKIRPGTRVAFLGNYSITVLGTILVQGNEGEPVKFASDESYSGKWSVLSLKGATSSTIDYVDMTDSEKGLRIEDVGSLHISHLTVDGSRTAPSDDEDVGLSIVKNTATAMNITVTDCVFENLDYGVHVYGCTPEINQCHFINISIYGIKEDARGNPIVTNCVFETSGPFAGDYYDQDLTIISVIELNALPGNSGNTANHPAN